MHRFEGEIAIVTGGAMGIGKAVVERLAREGASVLVATSTRGRARRPSTPSAPAGSTLCSTGPMSAIPTWSTRWWPRVSRALVRRAFW